jgi:xylulokinase
MIADVTGKSCVSLTVDEGPALGAALLAGVGVGVWPDSQAACRMAIKEKQRFEPGKTDYSAIRQKHKRIYPALKDWAAPANTIKCGARQVRPNG